MGGCFSSGSGYSMPSAHVVLLNGDLREFPVPLTVSEVLLSEASTSSSSSFLCSSDGLYFDEYIPSLSLDDQLQAGQIYFVLPETKLKSKLTASDMAALAVKASVALQKTSGSSPSSRRRHNKARISPFVLDTQQDQEQDKADFYNNFRIQKDGMLINKLAGSSYQNKASGLGVSRSGSVRKLQRYSSRRAKMAVRSFRLRLSTIYEGSVHQYT